MYKRIDGELYFCEKKEYFEAMLKRLVMDIYEKEGADPTYLFAHVLVNDFLRQWEERLNGNIGCE